MAFPPDQVPQPPEILNLGSTLLLQGKVIPSFAQWALTGEENLLVSITSRTAGANLSLRLRFLDAASGQILPSGYFLPVPSDGSTQQTFLALGTGYILNVVALISAQLPPFLGQFYVSCQLVRGNNTNSLTVVATLFAGWIAGFQTLGWPGTGIENSDDIKGYPRTILGTTPAPGVNVLETVPTRARWQLCSFLARLTTSAAAGNRQVQLDSVVGGITNTFAFPPLNQAPSTAVFYIWAPGYQATLRGDGGAQLVPWPNDLPITAGGTLQTITVGLQAGDQWDSVNYSVREILEVN